MKDISIKFPGGKRVDAHFDGKTVRTDQSGENGGEGAAPEPFDLVFVSMAPCVGIYVLEFCTSRNLNVEGLGVRLRSEYVPEEKRYAKISIALALPKAFPEKYRKAILRTADLCTVKRHILHPPEFDVFIDDSKEGASA